MLALPAVCSLCHNRPMSEKDEPVGMLDRGRLSSTAAFVVLLVLLAAGLAFVLTRTTRTEPTPGPRSTSSQLPRDAPLTDAQALATFRELDKLRQQAFEERDLDLVEEVFTAFSPSATTLKQTVRRLRNQGVFPDERLRVLQERILANSEREVRVEQVIVLDIVFNDAQGRDITEEGGKERQKVHWVMRYEDSRWQLHDGLVVAARPLP